MSVDSRIDITGGIAALHRGQRLGDRLLVAARIDRLDLDAGIFLLEVGGVAVDDLGDRAADGDRVVERDLRLAPARAPQRAAEQRAASARRCRAAHRIASSCALLLRIDYASMRCGIATRVGRHARVPSRRRNNAARPRAHVSHAASPRRRRHAALHAHGERSARRAGRSAASRRPGIRPSRPRRANAALEAERDVLGPHAERCRARSRPATRRDLRCRRSPRRPAPVSSASRFIGGVPMKRATNVFAGCSYSSTGAPFCSMRPPFSRTTRSAIDIASTWSCVTYTIVMPSCAAARGSPGASRRAAARRDWTAARPSGTPAPRR